MSKNRVWWWLVIAIPVVAVVLFVAAAAVLHSKAFQSYALGKLIQSVEENTGAQVRVISPPDSALRLAFPSLPDLVAAVAPEVRGPRK